MARVRGVTLPPASVMAASDCLLPSERELVAELRPVAEMAKLGRVGTDRSGAGSSCSRWAAGLLPPLRSFGWSESTLLLLVTTIVGCGGCDTSLGRWPGVGLVAIHPDDRDADARALEPLYAPPARPLPPACTELAAPGSGARCDRERRARAAADAWAAMTGDACVLLATESRWRARV